MSLNKLARELHQESAARGWWHDREAFQGQLQPQQYTKAIAYIIATKFALVHSEVSEALEGYRKGAQDDHLPHRSSVEVETADAIIRLLDLAGFMGLDIDGAIAEKRRYNQVRADHDPANRGKSNGKRF